VYRRVRVLRRDGDVLNIAAHRLERNLPFCRLNLPSLGLLDLYDARMCVVFAEIVHLHRVLERLPADNISIGCFIKFLASGLAAKDDGIRMEGRRRSRRTQRPF
jgi:hypothetical protein